MPKSPATTVAPAAPSGGFVFPLAYHEAPPKPGQRLVVSPGVTFRDYAALQIYMSRLADPSVSQLSPERLARDARVHADALVAELGRPGQ